MTPLFRRRPRSRRRGLVTVSEFSSRAFRRPGRALPPWFRPFALTVFGGLLLYFFVAGEMGLSRLVSLQRLRRQLGKQELELSAQVIDLDTRRRLLESDTTYIEKIARTEYHLSRPDETIYELTPDSSRAAPVGNNARP